MRLIVLGLLSALLHPDSLSSSRIEVRGHEATAVVRCQVVSLLEVLPGLDGDGDGQVDSDELAAGRASILAYVAAHYRLATGTDRDGSGGVSLEGRPVGVRLLPPPETGLRGDQLGLVDVELLYVAAAPLTDLLVTSTLFADTSPGHVDLLTLVWPDGATIRTGLDQGQPWMRSDPTGRGAFGAFVALGWHHILTGWDHLAFVLALILGSARLRSVLLVVTAFTLAHSLTLALAALGVVDVAPWSTLVEAAIALSIAYVAADVALHPDRLRSRWPEAFAFGLLHGLGFAGVLSRSLVDEPDRVLALLSFNVGVELGQVAVALLLVGLLLVVRPRGGDALAPRPLRRWASLAVATLGLLWFAQRV